MTVKFVLTMIVKNEGKIIGRCLDAALPHCAGYVISDTGSTDDTKEQILAAARRHNVEGWILDEKWKNFGWNRTLSAQGARQFVRAKDFDASRTYLLFVDGDMELDVDPGFDKETLTLPSYDLYQHAGGSVYPNTRLARADIEWRSVGVTHEFWAPGPGGTINNLLETGIRIQDRNDGGAKADKFVRDAALFEEDLKIDPTNVRSMFYLANTYYDLGRYAEAVEWYKKRRAAGGWDQELWYSHFRIGLAKMHLGDESAAGTMLEAYNERPQRAEPLFYLAQHYRGRGLNHAAMLLAGHVSKMTAPGGGELFLETGIYGGGPALSEEIAINAFHVGKHELGEREAEAIARGRGRHGEAYEQASRHLSHYAQPLARVAEGRFVVHERVRKGFSSSSPTIVPLDSGYLVHARLVNYNHAHGFSFVSRDPDGVIRTRGAVARWTPGKDEKLEWQEVVTEFPEEWSPKGIRVLGAEDQRWAMHDGRIYVTANTWQQTMKRDYPQMVLGRVHESLTKIDKWWPLPSPTGSEYEKNWLPWSRDGQLFFVYGYDPFRILHFNLETGAVNKALEYPTPFAAHRLRGSAGPVAHPEKKGHTLIMVHEKAIHPHEHVYMQRLVELDVASRPVAMSVPFYIDHRGVEFPLGFMEHEGKALITYGREERESAWALVEWKELLSRFR